MNLYPIIRPILFTMPPEAAHNMAIKALECSKLLSQPKFESTRLSQKLFGLDFPNPVGMAAGFDKNAQVLDGLARQNFGFIEVGTITPKPQDGNPKPRMFRLKQDQAVINRLGFNNKGADVAYKNIAASNVKIPIGINIGRNKNSANDSSDYVNMFDKMHELASYITINISSPNTAGLRDMQSEKILDGLLSDLENARKNSASKVPMLLKIAPDVSIDSLPAIIDLVTKYNINGMIISNTTISRPDSLHYKNEQQGGLSGAPLFDLSTKILLECYKLTKGTIPLIGVGGINSPEAAFAKIKAGASLIQLYSALIYKGFGLVTDINKYLAQKCDKENKNISDFIGIDA